jgi:hypothetical protein
MGGTSPRLSGSRLVQAELERPGVERRGRRRISESSRVPSVHEIGAHESNEFEEAALFMGQLVQGAQQVGDQGDGDLDADGVF